MTNTETQATPSKTKRMGAAWYMLAVLTLTYLLSNIDKGVLSVIVTPVKAEFGLTDVQVSLLLGLSFASLYGVMTLPAGYLVDRFSRRHVLLGGVSFWSAMEILCGLATSYWLLFLGRMGLGMGEATVSPAAHSLIKDAFPRERRGIAFSIFSTGLMMGNGLALVVGSLLLKAADSGALSGVPVLGSLKPWQFVLVATGLLGIPFLALIASIREPARQAVLAGEQDEVSFSEAFSYVWQHRSLYLPLFFAVVLFFLSGAGFVQWLPTAIQRGWDVKISTVGPIIGLIIMTCIPIGLLVNGTIIDALTKSGHADAPMTVGTVSVFLGTIATLALWPFVEKASPLAGVVFGVNLLLYGTYVSASSMVLAQVTPGRLMGKVTGMFLLMQNVLGTALGGWLMVVVAGGFYEGRGALGRGMISTYVCVSLIGVFLFWLVGRQLRARQAAGQPAAEGRPAPRESGAATADSATTLSAAS